MREGGGILSLRVGDGWAGVPFSFFGTGTEMGLQAPSLGEVTTKAVCGAGEELVLAPTPRAQEGRRAGGSHRVQEGAIGEVGLCPGSWAEKVAGQEGDARLHHMLLLGPIRCRLKTEHWIL